MPHWGVRIKNRNTLLSLIGRLGSVDDDWRIKVTAIYSQIHCHVNFMTILIIADPAKNKLCKK